MKLRFEKKSDTLPYDMVGAEEEYDGLIFTDWERYDGWLIEKSQAKKTVKETVRQRIEYYKESMKEAAITDEELAGKYLHKNPSVNDVCPLCHLLKYVRRNTGLGGSYSICKHCHFVFNTSLMPDEHELRIAIIKRDSARKILRESFPDRQFPWGIDRASVRLLRNILKWRKWKEAA